jgi:hypothetical protein
MELQKEQENVNVIKDTKENFAINVLRDTMKSKKMTHLLNALVCKNIKTRLFMCL